MKHRIANCLCLAAACLLIAAALSPAALATQKPDLEISLKRVYAATYDADGSMLEYPLLEANNASLAPIAEKINAAIARDAHIDEYTRLLSNLRGGGTGLIMCTDINYNYDAGQGAGGYLSCLIDVQGKMLSGPPSQVYYPMVFDLSTGERITFSEVFSDPEGARRQIEQYLADEIEPQLSTYLENSALTPVPFEQFAFSRNGLITFYYDFHQFSFLSGKCGAVSFRYSELWDWLDVSPDGVAMRLVSDGNGTHQYACAVGQSVDTAAVFHRECVGGRVPGLDRFFSIGAPMELLEKRYSFTSDSGYYPGGACLEIEDPWLRGTWALTDADETVLTGYLTSRTDAYGIETGKTTLGQVQQLLGEPAAQLTLDDHTAEQYLVCPGQALVYAYQEEIGHYLCTARCTLYFDADQILQYIKVEQTDIELF